MPLKKHSYYKISEHSQPVYLGPTFDHGDIIRVREISPGCFRYLCKVKGRSTIDSPLLESLDLSVRVLNSLKRAGFARVEDIVGMSDIELLAIKNFGQASLLELNEKLTNS